MAESRTDRTELLAEAAAMFVQIIKANEEGHSWGAAFARDFEGQRSKALALVAKLEA